MKIKYVTSIIVMLSLLLALLASCTAPSSNNSADTSTESAESGSESATNSDSGSEGLSESESESREEATQGGSSESESESKSESESESESVGGAETPDEIEQRYFIFRIWNFEIMSLEDFKNTVDRVALDGFNAIKIHIPWSHVEKVSGVYDFSPFDPMVDYVVNEKGMKVALSIDLTRTVDDQLLSDNDIMRSYDGDLSVGGSYGNRVQISLNSKNAVYKATEFYSTAVSHYEPLFGDDILFYLPAFSQYAESEYWCANVYDYSSGAISAFREFLTKNYGSIDALNKAIGTNYSSFSEIEPPRYDSSDDLGQLWYVFRHQSLKSFIDALADTQKWIAPDSKFALQFGSVWSDNSILRVTLGFVDLCEHADVLWVDDGPTTDHQFSMDYILTAIPDHIELAQEIDGPYHTTATPDLYLAQGMQCFERGATYMSIANWSINEDYERYSYAWRMIAETWLGSSTPSVVVPTESSPTIEISLLELYRERNISSIKNRHQLLSPNGEPVRIVIKDDLTSYIPQAPSNFAVFPSDFSSVQGGGGWYYKSYLDGKFTDMTFDASAGYWQGDSTYTRITGTNLHPDTHDAALVFKATDTGRISVNIYCHAASEFGDGIIFYILYNGSIFEVSGEEIRALVTDKTPYRLSFTAEVKEGDEIAFIINKNQHNTYDTTALSVYIKYE